MYERHRHAISAKHTISIMTHTISYTISMKHIESDIWEKWRKRERRKESEPSLAPSPIDRVIGLGLVLFLIIATTCEWVMSLVWMSNCIQEWVIWSYGWDWFCFGWLPPPVNESWHIWMSHVTYVWHMNESWNICVTYDCHHLSMSHGTRMVSHVTYGWVMLLMNESSDIWMSHVTHEWVMLHINGSCYIRMSHVTYGWVVLLMNESSDIWMSHLTYEYVTWWWIWGSISF